MADATDRVIEEEEELGAPLVDRLRAVPMESQVEWPTHGPSYEFFPVGLLCHEASNMLVARTHEVAQLRLQVAKQEAVIEAAKILCTPGSIISLAPLLDALRSLGEGK